MDKKLWRAAIEPARVFARRDFEQSSDPLLRYTILKGSKSYSFFTPAYPTWFVADGDGCKVIANAIQRYGVRGVAMTEQLDKAIVLLTDANKGLPYDLKAKEPKNFERKDGVIFPGWNVGGVIYPATPIAYAQRRWSDKELDYRSDGYLLRISLDGEVVVAIRAIESSTVSESSQLPTNVGSRSGLQVSKVVKDLGPVEKTLQ